MSKDNEKVVEESIVIEKTTQKTNNVALITIIVAVVLAILLVINFIAGGFKSKTDVASDIKTVKKILNEKYNEIDCVDSNCDYIVASSGDTLKKTTYNIFNTNGKKVGSYTVNYSKNNAGVTSVISATEKYIVTRTVNDKKINYVLRSNKGKALYSSDKIINSLNDNLAIVENKTNEYDILNYKGKKLYSNVSDYDTYSDGKYISIKVNDNYMLADKNGEKVLSNYKVSTEVKDEIGNSLYLVVEDTKKDNYYYFDINKNKKVGDSFSYYTTSDNEGELVITKSLNDKKVKYVLNKNGKQVKMSNDYTDQSESISKIKESIDTDKYYVYSYGIKDASQKYVLVNDREAKSFGILNVKSKDYKKLFDYSSSKSSAFASIVELDNKDDKIVRINCSKSNCDNETSIIYNLTKNKEIYSENNKNAIVSDYASYKNNYKVVRYSYLSSNDDLKGKYVLYDTNNKEVYKSSSAIAVIDSEIEIGKTASSYILLYSVSDKKTLNTEKTKADKIKIADKVLYKYTSKDNKTIVCNEKGKEVIKIDSSDYITYSNSNIIYMTNDRIYIYNAAKDRTRNYKLRDNEKLNDESNDIVSPYRGAVFINNSSDKMVKVINSKGKVIRKIKNAELTEVKKNKSTGEALIIVKKSSKNSDTYGLYLAK